MIKKYRYWLASILMALMNTQGSAIRAMEENEEKTFLGFRELEPDIQHFVFEEAVMIECAQKGRLHTLAVVCEEWNKWIVTERKPSPTNKNETVDLLDWGLINVWGQHNLPYFRTEFVFCLNPNSMVRLKIADLKNIYGGTANDPLAGAFDLSKCINSQGQDIGQTMYISSGYDFENEANIDKWVIHISFRDYIQKTVDNGESQCLKPILERWNPEVSIGLLFSDNVKSINFGLIYTDPLMPSVKTLDAQSLFDHVCPKEDLPIFCVPLKDRIYVYSLL